MTRGGLLALGFLAVLRSHAQTTLEYSPVTPSGPQIDDYLNAKHSPMAGIGAGLESLSRQHNVDPRLIVAISGAETTFGGHVCAANNAWNWFHHRTCPNSPFTSYQEGVEHVTRFMRRSYLNHGYDSIERIRYKYCVAGCDNWIPLVTRFYAEMPVATSVGNASGNASSSTSEPNRIFGLPAYIVFLGGAALVILWSTRAFRR